MKKKVSIQILSLLVVFILSLTFCQKKEETPPSANQSSTTSITPTYVTTSTLATTTSTNSTNTATQNSALPVGGVGWSYNSCSASSNTLSGFNGSTQVHILFGGASIISGSYAFTSGVPTAGQARMTIVDAPGQPTGILWYSKTGSVSVITGTAGTTASFSNIQCTQSSYNFPVVTVSGSLTCQ